MENVELYEIYVIKNKVNNKVYVGATSQGSAKRFKQHVWKAIGGSEYAFHKAIREFGADSFEVETLEYVDTVEELKAREKYWIIQLRSKNPEYGYNGDDGGDIMFHTPETKAKISAIHKGKDMSKFYRAVLQYDSDGNFLQEFPSVSHACEFTGISKASMIRALNKAFKTKSKVNPYVWFYKEELPDIPTKIDTSDMYCNKEYERKVSENFLNAGKNYKLTRNDQFLNTVVEQLDLEGNRISLFFSISEASRQTGISLRTIKEHCSGAFKDKLDSARIKCTWRKIEDLSTLTEDELNLLKEQELTAKKSCSGNNKRKVALYSSDNKLLQVFDTLQEAAKLTNVDRSSVGKQLKKYGMRVIPNIGYLKFYKQ